MIKAINSTSYPTAIEQLFNSYIEFLGETEELQLERVLDQERDRYLLIEVGWQSGRRIYGPLLHIDIINDKLWIQHDGTEAGVADELVKQGIPKDNIVLGFKSIERRRITEFAVS